jgi:hypothetical protein
VSFPFLSFQVVVVSPCEICKEKKEIILQSVQFAKKKENILQSLQFAKNKRNHPAMFSEEGKKGT